MARGAATMLAPRLQNLPAPTRPRDASRVRRERTLIDSKLPHVGTTIFTVMSQLANEHRAINLSQGFPDWDGAAEVLEGATYHLTHGHNQYAPMAGVAALREQVARKVADLYGAAVDMDTEVTITAGATEAIFCAITAVVRPGDEVVVFDPAY